MSPRPPYSVGIFIPNAPIAARALMSSSGIRASRSIRAPSMPAHTSRSRTRKCLTARLVVGLGRGCGCTRSRSNRPR